jgi:hypothetical protein
MVRPKLSIKAVKHLVSVLGLDCAYSHDYSEYRVSFKEAKPGDNEDSAYYTNDGDDALETARIMARTIGTDGRIKELSNGLLIVASV